MNRAIIVTSIVTSLLGVNLATHSAFAQPACSRHYINGTFWCDFGQSIETGQRILLSPTSITRQDNRAHFLYSIGKEAGWAFTSCVGNSTFYDQRGFGMRATSYPAKSMLTYVCKTAGF